MSFFSQPRGMLTYNLENKLKKNNSLILPGCLHGINHEIGSKNPDISLLILVREDIF